jgi:hypothetical protein
LPSVRAEAKEKKLFRGRTEELLSSSERFRAKIAAHPAPPTFTGRGRSGRPVRCVDFDRQHAFSRALLSNAPNITRAIAAVNRQNRGILKIRVGVADSTRIQCLRRRIRPGINGNAALQQIIMNQSNAFPLAEVYAIKKTALPSTNRHLLALNTDRFRNLYSIHSLRRRSNSNGAKFMADQSSGQKKTVKRVMHEYKHGELKAGRGRRGKVKNRKQAIAIALHESGASNQESPAENKRNLARTKRRERTGKTAASSGSKTSARKTSARKTTSGRKTSTRTTTGRKTSSRSTARKSTAGKSTARKSTPRKSTPRKSTARSSTARKSPTRRSSTATKRRSPSRSTARSTRRKSTARSTTTRRSKSPARSHRK